MIEPLPGLVITAVDDRIGWIIVHATTTTDRPTCCPECSSEGIVRFGTRIAKVADTPCGGRPVYLLVSRQRWRCKDCGFAFMLPTPGWSPKRRLTDRLIRHILDRAPGRPLAAVAAEVGTSPTTVSRVIRGGATSTQPTP